MCRVTAAQATIAFLKNQYVEGDGIERPFFTGCFGIFGRGNVARHWPGPATESGFSFLSKPQRAGHGSHGDGLFPDEQSPAVVCTSSIDPGATNRLLKGVVSRLESARKPAAKRA